MNRFLSTFFLVLMYFPFGITNKKINNSTIKHTTNQGDDERGTSMGLYSSMVVMLELILK